MPCNRGWVINTTLTFEGSSLKDPKLVAEALEALGFAKAQINDLGYEIRVSGRAFGGGSDLVLARAEKGYSIRVGQDDLRLLARKVGGRRSGDFITALNKSYAESFVQKIIRSTKGKVTRKVEGERQVVTIAV